MSEHSPTYRAPPDLGLDIRYIDDELLVVDKPAGLLSVPGRGPGKQDCLSARVQARYPEALPVHRLDLGTSGLLVLARSPDMHRALNRLFATRRVEKRYVALVAGCMEAGVRTSCACTCRPSATPSSATSFMRRRKCLRAPRACCCMRRFWPFFTRRPRPNCGWRAGRRSSAGGSSA